MAGGYVGSMGRVVDDEGKHLLRLGKRHAALDMFNKAAEIPGCCWPVFAHRADCQLRLLDFRGALQDAMQAVDMHEQEQRGKEPHERFPAPACALMTAVDALWCEAELEEALVIASRLQARHRGASLIGDERGQRVAGLTADISSAMGSASRLVLHDDLVRDMLRIKGINPERLTAGPRLSWVAESTMQISPPKRLDPAVDTPLPLPLIWGATPLDVVVGSTSDTEKGEEEEEKKANKEPGKEKEVQEDGQDGERAKEDKDVEDVAAPATAEGEERDEGEDKEGEGVVEDKKRVTLETRGEGEPGERGWGWLRQIPGHEHLCADPLVAAQAQRVFELRILGLLERDRAFLRRLVDDLETEQERPGEGDAVAGSCSCPGPNLAKWQYSELLRAEAMDEKQDPLAASKWQAQDLCRLTVEQLDHLVRCGMRRKGRYQLQNTALQNASPRMREEVRAARRERALSTVHFMLRRVHDLLRSGQDRDVEHVGARLTAYLEKLPCRIFQDRLLAMARTLDCRAVAARRKRNLKLAIEMQKRRCTLASEHGLPELYVRALDEVALLLFAVADYQMAETSWNERLAQLAQLHGHQGQGDGAEERVQTLFQLARCCFVQGSLRVARGASSAKQHAMVKKDHRSKLPEYGRH